MKFLGKTFSDFESSEFLGNKVILFMQLYRQIGYSLNIIHHFHDLRIVHYLKYLRLAKLEHIQICLSSFRDSFSKCINRFPF